ncbi:PRC-barrel domain-containing protein [soil metagenome]
MLRRAKELLGYTISAADSEQIGQIHDFYFDTEDWEIRYVVVDIGSWLFGRRVLLAPDTLQKPDWENKIQPVNLTKAQIKDSPPVDFDKPISRQYEADLHQHYNWPTYWGGGGLPYTTVANVMPTGAPMAEPSPLNQLPAEVVEGLQQSEESHVQSIRELTNHALEAIDGSIGHITDCFIDDENWTIRYLIVDTGHWRPGNQVLIPQTTVDNADWVGGNIYVKLTQEQVKQSPAYEPNRPLDQAYTAELDARYDDHEGRKS